MAQTSAAFEHGDPIGRDHVESVIATGEIVVAWQPIVSLESREVLGYEALARFPVGENGEVSPQVWFSAATVAGLREELEMVAVRSALAQLGNLPEDAFVSLNISPSTVAVLEGEPDLLAAVESRVVLELREDDAVEASSEVVSEALGRLRERGVRLALDDAGSGLVSLRQLLGVDADIVKIDTDVTRGIDEDVTRQALAYALRSAAERSGAMSVAEGVETEEEADMLASLGVDAAQGYLFGRPAELSD